MLREQLLQAGFQDNEYLDQYIELIEYNKLTKRERYKTAQHHIVPRCYFKATQKAIDNSATNLVNLLHKDHLTAHYYLALCAPEHLKGALVGAFCLMLDAPYTSLRGLDLGQYQALLEQQFHHSVVARAVVCIELQRTFPSIAEAARQLNCEESSINRCLAGALSKAGGYHWALAEDKSRQEQLSSYIGQAPKVYRERAIYCAELDRVFSSGKEASERLNIALSSINDCCRGRQRRAGGYHWAYLENQDSIKQYKGQRPTAVKERAVLCVETGEIFSSLKEAAQVKNITNKSGITCCCRGTQKTAGGFQWQYVL